MVGLGDAIDGLPTQEGAGYLGAPDLGALVDQVIAATDDLDVLNTLHDTAYSDCAEAFSWETRARDFVTALGPDAPSVLV